MNIEKIENERQKNLEAQALVISRMELRDPTIKDTAAELIEIQKRNIGKPRRSQIENTLSRKLANLKERQAEDKALLESLKADLVEIDHKLKLARRYDTAVQAKAEMIYTENLAEKINSNLESLPKDIQTLTRMQHPVNLLSDLLLEITAEGGKIEEYVNVSEIRKSILKCFIKEIDTTVIQNANISIRNTRSRFEAALQGNPAYHMEKPKITPPVQPLIDGLTEVEILRQETEEEVWRHGGPPTLRIDQDKRSIR